MENTDERYECCFEEPHKGIYMTVQSNNEHNYIELSTIENMEVVGSVCLRDNDVDKLIKQLQNFKNRDNN